MILEGIVTTLGPDETFNIAPMGPTVDAGMERLLLRPFPTSRTYQNLRQHGEGVFHVTDDVFLLAKAAVGTVAPPPSTVPAEKVRGVLLADACRAYEFRIRSLDDTQQRVHIQADILHTVRFRDFFGFNRAKHAVVEAAILATRVDFLPIGDVRCQYARLRTMVEKTGGEQEHEAFQYLVDYVERAATRNNTPS
ncbi:MAG: DUF447 domain-containing protein [Gemmataceae bacterium]